MEDEKTPVETGLKQQEITISKSENEQLLNYLSTRPWVEVNALMVMMLNKIKPQVK